MALVHRKVTGKFKNQFGIFEVGIDICICDKCSIEFEQKISQTEGRRKSKISNGRDLCKLCTKQENSKRFGICGTETLSKLSPEQRKENASKAGIKSAENYDPTTNKGRFSTERWNNMSDEEKLYQVKRANNGLKEKLKDPIWAAKHFAKVLSQSKIGYQSKGHKDLHNFIEKYGFRSHVQIDRIQVDECNEELKIVVEYNGDMWHCNPRKYKADDYNPAIRMTAGEKWKKDIARKKFLESLGYSLVIIWESGWIENPQKYIDRIENIYNEIIEKRKNTNSSLL